MSLTRLPAKSLTAVGSLATRRLFSRAGAIATHTTLSNSGCTDCESCVFYFLVFGTCLALAALFFSCLAASALTCFCTVCLCVAFGDLSPMT
jgi:hypothetical protein